MTIARLALQNFRNHQQFAYDAHAQFNVIFGANGAGKTNILEALSLLSPGRGLRRAPLHMMARQGGAGDFAISAHLGNDVHLGTGRDMLHPNKRRVKINGSNSSALAMGEWLAPVWLTPAMDGIFMGSAGERRRFCDRLVQALRPQHVRVVAHYDNAMRQRNKLLEEGASADGEWLSALERQMARDNVAIAEGRNSVIQQLNLTLSAGEDVIFARPLLAMSNPVSMAMAMDDWMDEEFWAEKLRDGRARDQAAGRTLTGTHRDDLLVTMRQKNQDAALCSTGEQKAMLIAIILAHADMMAGRGGAQLVLLLDEVAAHLDAQRRAALYEILAEKQAQIWLTGTDKNLFADIADNLRHDIALMV